MIFRKPRVKRGLKCRYCDGKDTGILGCLIFSLRFYRRFGL